MIKADTTELDMKKLTERLKKLNEKGPSTDGPFFILHTNY